MSALIVFADGRWLRSDGMQIVARGDQVADALPLRENERTVAIAAATDCIVRRLDLPDLADAQAQVAARLALAEEGLATFGTAHVAAGRADADGRRMVAAVSSTHIVEQLVELAAHGLDPDHIIPAALLLPLPAEEWWRADLGSETVVRGAASGFVDDPAISPLLTDGAEIETLDRPTIEAAIVAAVASPEVDLRQGAFAKRRQWNVDQDRVRRLAIIVLSIGLTILAAQIVQIVRIGAAATRITADTAARAAAILPPGTVVTDPAMQAEARLGAVRGAGGGFLPLATAVAAAVNATPNVDIGTMTFEGDGSLRATVKAGSAADLEAVQTRLVSAGLTVYPAPVVANLGRPYRDITVRQP